VQTTKRSQQEGKRPQEKEESKKKVPKIKKKRVGIVALRQGKKRRVTKGLKRLRGREGLERAIKGVAIASGQALLNSKRSTKLGD